MATIGRKRKSTRRIATTRHHFHKESSFKAYRYYPKRLVTKEEWEHNKKGVIDEFRKHASDSTMRRFYNRNKKSHPDRAVQIKGFGSVRVTGFWSEARQDNFGISAKQDIYYQKFNDWFDNNFERMLNKIMAKPSMVGWESKWVEFAIYNPRIAPTIVYET